MFGCCVAGRLLQTNLQQVDETHALFELPQAGTINHVCVFLLGTGMSAMISSYHYGMDPCCTTSVPFPDGYGATVHFFWPGKGFQLLGMYVIFYHSDRRLEISLINPGLGSPTRNPPPSFACAEHSPPTPHQHIPKVYSPPQPLIRLPTQMLPQSSALPSNP